MSLVAVAGLLTRIAIAIMFAPMLAVSPGTGSLAFISSADTGQQAKLCPMMSLEKRGGSGSPVNKEDAPEDCPICLAMAATVLALASLSFDFTRPVFNGFVQPAKPAGLVLQRFARHIRNRSPPIFS
ncbi:MAG: DUF2946 family protein [Hyphomicrobiaceae bacterium]|nr:DUF2946 family protein [Hyphomicrobiaceae bacterium]